MIKLLALDLDETLLSSDKHVSKENVTALQKARENGIHTVIATGRPWFSFVETLEEIGTRHLQDEVSITLNGGAIVENESGKILALDGLDYPTANMLFKHAIADPNLCIHVNTTDQAYGWNLNDDEREFLIGRLDIIELEQPDLFDHRDEHFVKVLYGNTDIPYLENILEQMKSVSGDFDVSFSSSRYLESNKKGVNKGSGLKKLAKMMNIDISETAAIGDHANDLEMIKTAGLGIAVSNAIDEVKAAAKYITTNDHNHHAVAEAVEYILKLNQQEQKPILHLKTKQYPSYPIPQKPTYILIDSRK